MEFLALAIAILETWLFHLGVSDLQVNLYWQISQYVNKGSLKNSLDAGIQDESTSISIVVKVDLWLEKKKKLMKVTNIYKHEIVDTRA